MAVAAVQVRSILSKLGTLTSDEYELSEEDRGDIMTLIHEMEMAQAVLNKLSMMPANQIDEFNKIWLMELTELSYEIEGRIDALLMVISNASESDMSQSIRRFSIKRMCYLDPAMEDIKMSIREVNETRQRFHLMDAARRDKMTVDPRVLASFQHISTLVGTDAPVQKIANLLTQGNYVTKQKLLIVSIVGVGGLGKTTIASLVYQELGEEFECKAFVSLPHNPDMKHALLSILRQVTQDKIPEGAVRQDERGIISIIRKFLMDKRYLIVFDDVWDKEAWIFISNSLIDNYLSSRVIVTTRNIDLANLSLVGGTIYELDPLSDEDSKRLLSKRVFNDEDAIVFELEEVTKNILKRCGGVPLAIITIASMLASRPNKTMYEWYNVYNSMGSGLVKDNAMNDMREILSLSYGDWPSYLKPCLLYLSMFPQDYEIKKDRLIRMWVAEGFVDETQGKSLYEIGESYFTALVNRSMIQPVDMNENGNARAYRVRGMILDHIVSLSAQENVVTIVEGTSTTLIPPDHKIRRLSLHGSKVDSNEEDSTEEQVKLPIEVDLSCVRSLTVFGDAFHWMPPLSKFPIVRVLALESIPRKIIHLKDLVKLQHLRYLKLGGEPDAISLEQIGNLQLLETLDLWDASIQELPSSIVQLRKLEHLVINAEVKLPQGIGNLISLQELTVLNADKSPSALAELGNLTKLRQLSIQGLHDDKGYMMSFLQSLSNLSSIRSLIFLGNGLCSLDNMLDRWKGPSHLQSFIGGKLTISRLPQWFSSLFKLSFLSIEVKMLTQDDLLLLGELSRLHYLELQLTWDGIIDKQLVIGIDQPFRSLGKFKFRHSLRCRLVFAPGVMPNLQKLELYFNVTKREGGWFDIGLENLTSLKNVTVKVDCDGARMREVEDAEINFKDSIYIHPNHPTLELSRHSIETMAKEEMSPEINRVPDFDIFDKTIENILLSPSPTPVSLSLEFLEAITGGFSRELGRGGYGVVYKGVLHSGNLIAVKKIFDRHLVEDNNQFQNEVTNVVGTKHENIVQLVGYCVESRSKLVLLPSGKHVMAEVPNMLLCFEYISNRSLYDYVTDEFSGFDWHKRYEIIKGIGNGLHFLHEICHIVHLDLKPQNILMDGTMIPKIADFGLSRLLGEQKTRTIINGDPAGTLGYMAPEYLLRGEVSAKADIFSFGVIIIQIITGDRDHPQSTILYSKHASEDNSLKSIETSIQHFKENVLQRWSSRFVTLKTSSTEICIQQVEKCITLALKCVNNDLEKRPTTREIIEMLNAVES